MRRTHGENAAWLKVCTIAAVRAHCPSRQLLMSMSRSLTRRSFLAASAAAAAGPAFAAPVTSGEVDVVVIGAGAAGIAAGRKLAAANRRFVVVEASERIGGRCFTDN